MKTILGITNNKAMLSSEFFFYKKVLSEVEVVRVVK